MEIKLNLNAAKVPPVAAPPPAARVSKAPEDQTEFRAAAALEKALQASPEVRPEVVERAQQLVGEPSYPPRETLQRIATLLALKLRP